MKADVDKDGYLRIDAQTFVQSLPDEVLRTLAKYALFDELLLTGLIDALVQGTMWSDDDEGPWWFDTATFTKLRLKLLPLLPDVTAEAVRHLEVEARKARADQQRWNDAAWKLWHAWPDRLTRPEHPTWAYEHREAMTRDQAEAHLRAIESKLAGERTELEQLRAEVTRMRPVYDAAKRYAATMTGPYGTGDHLTREDYEEHDEAVRGVVASVVAAEVFAAKAAAHG